MLLRLRAYESVPGSPLRHAIDGSISGMEKEKKRMHRCWQYSTVTAVKSRSHGNNKHPLNHSNLLVRTALSKRISHIRSKNRSETWIECESHNSHDHKIKITRLGHIYRVHAYSQDAKECAHASMQSMCRVCEGSTEQEGGKHIWLAVLECDVQPWLLSHLQWDHANKVMNHCYNACIGITTHRTRVNLSAGRIVFWKELIATTRPIASRSGEEQEHWCLDGAFGKPGFW